MSITSEVEHIKDIQQDTMGKSLVPPLIIIIINFFFHSLSVTVHKLLLNEKRYEHFLSNTLSYFSPFL